MMGFARVYHANGDECITPNCPMLHREERQRGTVDLALDTRSAHEQRSGEDRRAAWDHPQHYGGADNPYEAIKVIEAWALDFCLGNTVKYISRAGKKDPAKEIEDLEKARWYLDRRIAQLQRGNAEELE